MNQYTKIIAVVVVLLIVLYGGYRLYHHFTYKAPAPVPVVAMPTKVPTMAPENSVYKIAQSAKLGQYFTDLNGMTLYTRTWDKPGVSTCIGACLKLWPAYIATSAATNVPANVTVITRTDGIKQYAYKGMPLYYDSADKKAGDTLGQGLEKIWFVVK